MMKSSLYACAVHNTVPMRETMGGGGEAVPFKTLGGGVKCLFCYVSLVLGLGLVSFRIVILRVRLRCV